MRSPYLVRETHEGGQSETKDPSQPWGPGGRTSHPRYDNERLLREFVESESL